MATAESPGTQALPGYGSEGGNRVPRIEIPTVAAVVVTRNPGPWLEQALRSLGSQDYPSAGGPRGRRRRPTRIPSERIAGALPEAFVRRVAATPGFAAAANEALYTVAERDLPAHLPRRRRPRSRRRCVLMLEEAYRSNAGIVGPKIVDADNPEVLLEVGRSHRPVRRTRTPGSSPASSTRSSTTASATSSTSRTRPCSCGPTCSTSSAASSLATFPGAEDLDLCWRARLAGARVLVAPDARVQHHQAAGDRGDGAAPDAAAMARNRISTVLTLSSARTLLWVVPVGVAASFVEAFLLTITLRRGRVRSALGAWWWNLRRFRQIRRRAARRAAIDASTTATCASYGRTARGCAGSSPSTSRPTTVCARSPTWVAPP